jgi:hypothetical protein
MSAYTTEVAVENYLLTDIDPTFSAQITEWIAAISAHIEQYTGRVFVADTEASERLFEGQRTNKLLIDDCVAVTKVEQGDTYGDSFVEISSGDYQLLPYNALPKNAIGLKRTIWGAGIHRITAKWGYSVAAPADIKFACTVLVAGIVNTQVRTGTAKKSESIGNYSVAYSDDKGVADFENALAILDRYKRLTV